MNVLDGLGSQTSGYRGGISEKLQEGNGQLYHEIRDHLRGPLRGHSAFSGQVKCREFQPTV
jgi:hypothetical protein